ncbi:MAG: hypothetical protein ACOX5G_02055 [Kiritimatiellia bacterium]
MRNPVAIAPPGIRAETPPAVPRWSGSSSRTLLFASRIQRKKGLVNLVRAWGKLPAALRKASVAS